MILTPDGHCPRLVARGLPELVHFASGLQREHSAVEAFLTLPYSNGQVEGQITKLKRLKRQLTVRSFFRRFSTFAKYLKSQIF
jgi:transposase